MRALPNPSPLAAAFIEDLTNLLVSETVEIRDVVRDALGYELSAGLYSRLLKHLDE
jgi:neurofibromin 1